MENQMETAMEAWDDIGFSQNLGYHFGGPIIRTIVYWGLYWGPPILGNYHIGLSRDSL